MPFPDASLNLLRTAISFGLISCVIAFLWAPILTKILYKYKITRRAEYDPTMAISERKSKAGIPIMGGLLVIVTIAVITGLFNWERKFTWMPIGVMLLAALLGGIDDILHIYGHERRNRKLAQVLKLIRVHKSFSQRIWLIITLPWSIFNARHYGLVLIPAKGFTYMKNCFYSLLPAPLPPGGFILNSANIGDRFLFRLMVM